MISLSRWKLVFGMAFFMVLLFIWGNEILDFPHLFLGAPTTPINWRESIIETVFAGIFGVVAYRFILFYQKKWLASLDDLQRLATLDTLTNALNRRAFFEQAAYEFSRSKRSGHPFTLAMIDFDDFKGINDRFGHLCGDKVLISFVNAAKHHIRQHDLLGRLGGDEFGIILVDINNGDADLIQDRILEEWNRTEIQSDEGRKIFASVSMGVTDWNQTDTLLEDVIRRADKLLYHAKALGRNRIEAG